MEQDKKQYLTSFKDRHGTIRWRFRRNGKTVSLRGNPGEPAFEEAYQAALAGIETPKKVVRHPNSAIPKTFGAAWNIVLKSAEWKRHGQATRDKNDTLASLFLNKKIAEHDPTLWKDVPVSAMKRRHLKGLIAEYSDTPHKAKHILTAIRKMITVALDEEWIEVDPSTFTTVILPKIRSAFRQRPAK